MNANVTYLGQLIILMAIVFAVIGFILGKRKTETPGLVALITFLSSFLPPLSVIYLMVLTCKQDVSPEK